MSDDEISLLSDDGVEKPPVKAPAPRAANPPPPSTQAAPSKVNKWLKAASAVEEAPHALENEEDDSVARKKKKKKKQKVIEEEAYAAEDEGYEDEGEGDDGEEGRMKREKAIDYLSKFNSKGRQKEGPSTWAEVDESELKIVADNLIQNINRTQKDSILDQIFASTSNNGSTSTKDPLGMGSFDTVNLRLVRGAGKEETTAQSGRSQRRLVNKWHKNKTGVGKGEDGDEDQGAGAGLGFALPPEINPSSESFVPDLYLAQFHADTSLAQLKKGMKNLDMEMSEKGRLLKALIKNNFERFISSKDTIDDIYIKLHRMEDGQGGSTMKLLKAIEQVKATSYATWGDILDRSVKIDRIKSVSGLLRRFNNLFGMPSRIYAHEASGDFDQIVREYNRANALIKPSSTTSRVWISLYQEVEKRISECYSRAKKRLKDPEVTSDEVPDLVIFLAQLVAEKLPGTREDDPMRIYLTAVDDQLTMLMQDYEAELDESLFELSKKHRVAKKEESLRASSAASASASAAEKIVARDNEAAAEAHQEPQTDVELLMWPGPPEWLLGNMGLPKHLTQIIRNSLSSSTGNPIRDAAQHASQSVMGGSQSVMGGSARLKRRLTPAQASWLLYLTSCNQQVAQRLVAAWTASNSVRLASSISTGAKASRTEGGSFAAGGGGEWQGQVTEIVGLARRGIERASSCCLDLIRRVTQRLGERCTEVVTALLRGGPMQLSTELAITDLSHTWLALSRAGCPMDAIEVLLSSTSPPGLGGSLYFCLGEYTRSLAAMMKDAPKLLLDQEDWRVGSKSREGQPSTSLPSRLQSIISSAMHSYGSMLAVVSSVNSEPPSADSWVPIQDGFFSSFEAYCIVAKEMLVPAAQLEGDDESGDMIGRGGKSKAALDKINEEGEVGVEAGGGHHKLSPLKVEVETGTPHPSGGRRLLHNKSSLTHRERENLSKGRGKGLDADILHQGSSLGIDSNTRDLGSSRISSSQRGGRLLIVMSNATMLRTTVLPSAVEMHRSLLVGPSTTGRSKGDAKAKQAAKHASESLGSLVSDLLESYLDIQEATIKEIVSGYLSPTNPSVFHAATANRWGEEDFGGQRQPLLTEGLHAIYAQLLKVHTQVFTFAPPMTIRPVWETLVECLASSLSNGYTELEVGVTSMERMMDLLLDLEYLECMWSSVANGPRGKKQTRGKKDRDAPLSPSGHFETAFLALGQMIIKVVSTRGLASKGRGSMSSLERAFQGLIEPSEAIERGRQFFGRGLLDTLIEQYGNINSKLFSLI